MQIRCGPLTTHEAVVIRGEHAYFENFFQPETGFVVELGLGHDEHFPTQRPHQQTDEKYLRPMIASHKHPIDSVSQALAHKQPQPFPPFGLFELPSGEERNVSVELRGAGFRP